MNTRIKELRNALGMSQAEFAANLNLGQTAVSSMERGASPVMERTISQLVSVFGVDETWLRTGAGDMFPPPPEEDAELIEAFGLIGGADMDPVRKRLARAVIEMLIELPDDAIPPVRKFIENAARAFSETEKNSED